MPRRLPRCLLGGNATQSRVFSSSDTGRGPPASSNAASLSRKVMPRICQSTASLQPAALTVPQDASTKEAEGELEVRAMFTKRFSRAAGGLTLATAVALSAMAAQPQHVAAYSEWLSVSGTVPSVTMPRQYCEFGSMQPNAPTRIGLTTAPPEHFVAQPVLQKWSYDPASGRWTWLKTGIDAPTWDYTYTNTFGGGRFLYPESHPPFAWPIGTIGYYRIVWRISWPNGHGIFLPDHRDTESIESYPYVAYTIGLDSCYFHA